MPLIGALFNHDERLSRLLDLKRRLLQQAAKHPRPATKTKPRTGEIRDAIVAVLTKNSPTPMSVKEILYSAEDLLGKRVSRDTVNSFLAVNAKGTKPLFVRAKAGRYRLA